MTNKRLLCKTCSNLLILNGFTSTGKKRWRCTFCGSSRIYLKEKDELYDLFCKYILYGMTYATLSRLSGYSLSGLRRRFLIYLEKPPPIDISVLPKKTPVVLLADGLWFTRWFVLLLYRESTSLKILHISTGTRERKSQVSADVLSLSLKGWNFCGFVTDGSKPILGALQKVYPRVPHQVCMAHMHRNIVNALGRHPKDIRVLFLKRLTDLVWSINTFELKNSWEIIFDFWVRTYQTFIDEKRMDTEGRWWYIHKGVRTAVNRINSMLEQSFTYLQYPLLPRTTNQIEAQCGHIGKRFLEHRGLSRKRWKNFLSWFVFFYNENIDRKEADRKSREDIKKHTK